MDPEMTLMFHVCRDEYKEKKGSEVDNTLYHVGSSLLPVPCSCGEQFACFPLGSSSSGSADTSSTPKMKRLLLGKSPFSLAPPLLDPSSPVPQPLKAPAVRPLPRHWGFKLGKMDLEGVPSQSSTHPSSVFHTITCLAACRAFLPPFFSPSLNYFFLFFFFCFVSNHSTWL